MQIPNSNSHDYARGGGKKAQRTRKNIEIYQQEAEYSARPNRMR